MVKLTLLYGIASLRAAYGDRVLDVDEFHTVVGAQQSASAAGMCDRSPAFPASELQKPLNLFPTGVHKNIPVSCCIAVRNQVALTVEAQMPRLTAQVRIAMKYACRTRSVFLSASIA